MLKKELRSKTIKRRVIEIVLFVSCMIIVILSLVWREQGKVVETVWGMQLISYSRTYLVIPAACGFFISIMSLITFVIDVLYCGTKTAETQNDSILIYTGLLCRSLYISEEKADTLLGKSYLEGKLSDGVRLTASYQFFNSFHLTFSDNRTPIDL